MKKFYLILSVIAILIAVLIFWQWGNIKAVFLSLVYSSEQIETIVAEKEEKANEVLKETTSTEFHPLTEEEAAKLQDGSLTKEEALDIIKGETDQKNDTSDNGEIDSIISEIYLLRSSYVSELAALENEAMRAAGAMPKKDRTASKKLSFVNYFVSKAVALEDKCDSQMENILSRLKVVLKKQGKGTALISEIRESYASQKMAKKTQLLNKYSKYIKN